jgi:hypothetical protein
MPGRSAFLPAVLFLTVFSPAPLLAGSFDHWYQPHYLASAEDASDRLKFLSPHFIPGNGGGDPVWQKSSFSLKNMSQSALGINFFFTQVGVEQKSDGIFSAATTSVPFSREIVASIVYADIDYYMVEGLPAGTGKNPWCIYPFSGHNMQNSVICVTTESEAHQVVDALATLAAANGKDLVTDPGMWLLSPSSKELRKHPNRVCQAYFVEVDGPPERAGMQSGDIVHTVNGTACSNEVLYAAIAAAVAKPGNGNIHVEILRKGQSLAFDLHYPPLDDAIAQLRQQSAAPSARHPVGSVIAVPDVGQAAPPAPEINQAAPTSPIRFGCQVRAVTDADVTTFSLAKAKGIVVINVEKGGLAEGMGIESGDVILEVNDSEIGDLQFFTQFVRSGAAKKFRIWRKGKAIELVVPESI